MPACLSCSREIPTTSAFCSFCGSPNPEATPSSAPLTDNEALQARLQSALGPGFTVEQVLGEGGFAVVFAVLERKLSRRIAVKVLRSELVASRASKQRFVREAESVARLNHPHILPIFFVGENQGLVYFGMPLVEGESLEARLRRDGKLPEVEVARIGAEIADALSEAHGAGFVHRDIKPLNVMLQGTRGRVLVADFGIAKAAAGSAEKLTGTGIAIGSPHYMSPEQAGGEDEVDHRSDIYSLGILLWQMLAGELPFESAKSQAVLMQQMTRDVPPIKARRPDVSAAMATVVARCTAKNPSDRFQTADEVARALQQIAFAGTRTAEAPLWRRPSIAAAIGVLAMGALAVMLMITRPWASGADAGGADDATVTLASAPMSSAPVIAVLPFSAVTAGDTGQFGRSAALMFSEVLALRNGVTTVDGNNLLARWLSERRSVAAPLDTNARFAYSLGANQMIVGNYVQSGTTFRLTVTMYDTHTLAPLWRDEATGPADSLFARIDQLASSAANSLCTQPAYNPASRCFDTPARPRETLAVNGDSGDGPLKLLARISATGAVTDVRVAAATVSDDEDLLAQAVAVVNDARFDPARKNGRTVEAWTEIDVPVRAAAGAMAAAEVDQRCEDPNVAIRNPDGACFDQRPAPDRAPVATVPNTCDREPAPVTVLVRVDTAGAVSGAPELKGASDCRAFNQAALASAGAVTFEPAQKSGRAVSAWTLLLVRPAAGAPAATRGTD